MRYVAFLLGINLGKRQVKMDKLKTVFQDSGYENVKTILASGNVIFESKESNLEKLQKEIQEKLFQTLGFEIIVILRTHKDVKELVDSTPFKNTPKDFRYFVTFVMDNPNEELSKKDFKMLEVRKHEILFALSKDMKTTDAMARIKKAYGKNITTRNWNTIVKIRNL